LVVTIAMNSVKVPVRQDQALALAEREEHDNFIDSPSKGSCIDKSVLGNGNAQIDHLQIAIGFPRG
jgi:hypothetical protein